MPSLDDEAMEPPLWLVTVPVSPVTPAAPRLIAPALTSAPPPFSVMLLVMLTPVSIWRAAPWLLRCR